MERPGRSSTTPGVVFQSDSAPFRTLLVKTESGLSTALGVALRSLILLRGLCAYWRCVRCRNGRAMSNLQLNHFMISSRLLFVIFQGWHRDLGLLRVGAVNRFAVVSEGLL